MRPVDLVTQAFIPDSYVYRPSELAAYNTLAGAYYRGDLISELAWSTTSRDVLQLTGKSLRKTDFSEIRFHVKKRLTHELAQELVEVLWRKQTRHAGHTLARLREILDKNGMVVETRRVDTRNDLLRYFIRTRLCPRECPP